MHTGVHLRFCLRAVRGRKEGRTETGRVRRFHHPFERSHQGPPRAVHQNARPTHRRRRPHGLSSCAIIPPPRKTRAAVQPHHSHSEPSRAAIFSCPSLPRRVGLRSKESLFSPSSVVHSSWPCRLAILRKLSVKLSLPLRAND